MSLLTHSDKSRGIRTIAVHHYVQFNCEMNGYWILFVWLLTWIIKVAMVRYRAPNEQRSATGTNGGRHVVHRCVPTPPPALWLVGPPHGGRLDHVFTEKGVTRCASSFIKGSSQIQIILASQHKQTLNVLFHSVHCVFSFFLRLKKRKYKNSHNERKYRRITLGRLVNRTYYWVSVPLPDIPWNAEHTLVCVPYLINMSIIHCQ